MYATKKQRLKNCYSCGVWGACSCVWVRVGCGVWGAGVRRAKAKKLQAKQKKINPPYQKNSDFVWA